MNTEGAFYCVCSAGFKNENELQRKCIDIDECNEFDCGFNNTCTNTLGSYRCECNAGYCNNNEWEACKDIDECSNEVESYEPDQRWPLW